MRTKNIKLTMSCIAAAMFVYLCIAFIKADVNFIHWDEVVRFGCIFYAICSILFVIVINKFNEKNEQQ